VAHGKQMQKEMPEEYRNSPEPQTIVADLKMKNLIPYQYRFVGDKDNSYLFATDLM
jgi:hypothetical protein